MFYNLTEEGYGTKGYKFNEEQLKRLSESHVGERNGFYGKHHSEETKKKLSEISKGRVMSLETKKKIAENRKSFSGKIIHVMERN